MASSADEPPDNVVPLVPPHPLQDLYALIDELWTNLNGPADVWQLSPETRALCQVIHDTRGSAWLT